VKLLFDQNLSHRLPVLLADLHPTSSQVRLIGMEQAEDAAIWAYAKAHGFTVVTKDADFAERSGLYGSPPKVVWLRFGNCSARDVELVLRRNHLLLSELNNTPGLHWVEIHR